MNNSHKILALTTLFLFIAAPLSAQEAQNALSEPIEKSETAQLTTMVDRLQRILANHYVLYTKTQKYHWNVEGKHFNDLHAFFGTLYAAQQKNIDLIAERIRALDAKVASTLQEFKSQATLTENPNNNPNEQEMIASLLHDYQILIAQLKTDLLFAQEQGDSATNNFLTDLVFQYEKTAWMLKALLAK
ncbi:MAG: Dps family protein [Candidatus Babeliales bacterium]